MQIYGNEIWNAATPNSEKAVMITEKEHLEAALKALDEAGVNYCYYVKDNEVTIAFAKIAVQRSELENLRKIPELSGLSIVPAKGDYTPKTTVIGNTAYKDIQNRHYQKLETDLALKVANELHQNGIHFSGRIYGQSTTITIDSADKQEFERIVQDIVSVRNSYQRKLEGISLINENISALNEGSQIILKPLADMCYTRGEEFTNQLFTLIDEADDFTEQQLKLYSAEFMKIYEPLSDSEYLFADRTSLDRLKEQFAKDNLFDDVTYLRGYSTEQKAAIRYLIENTQYFPDVLYNMIDFNFSPSDIRRIGEIWKEDLSNAPERIYQLIGDIKGYDPSNVRNYIRLGTYIPDTAELDRFKYITDEYTTGENADGSVIYRIPIETNVGILNRLAENGVIEEGLQNAHLILESDGKDYNVILTMDNNDVQLGSIVISDFLTDREQSVVSNVVNEVIQSEQVKQLAHEADTDLDSKSSEGINDDLEQIVASIGEKGKTFTEMVKAGEFSKAREILKELNVLALQAERQKAVIQQEAITTEDVDKLRGIEPKRKSVQNMLETEVAQTPKFERLLGEELGEKSPYEMRRGNTDWRNDETATVPVVKISSLEIPPKITDIRKSEYLKGIQRGIFVNQDTGIEITFGRNAVDEIIAKAIPDAKRNRPIEGRLAAVHNISELIEKSICFDSEISDYDSVTSKNKSPNTLFMHKLYSVFSYNGTYYLACLSVEEMYSRDPLDHDRIGSTSNRLYSLKDIKITPTELGLDTHDLMPVGISSVPIGVIYDLTIPQLYEIVKEYDHSFYENEQSPGRAERLEEIQAQEDFQSSVEVLQSHISRQEDVVAEEEAEIAVQASQTEQEQAVQQPENEQTINLSDQAEIETVVQKQESVQPKEDQTVSVPEESPQLSFDVTSTNPAKNEPDNTVLLDLNEYDDPDYYEQQQIAEQEAAEVPNPENFRITDSEIGSGTPLQRFNNNLAAIRLLKDLEADGRQASPEEQETLSRYVGWGGLAEFFKESNPHYQELRDLLTEDEYSSARATTLDSFYTSPVIIDSIYTVLQNSGFEGGNILEPSMGIGNFFGRMPQEMQSQSKLFGVEIDSLTGRIAKQLYPDAHIDIKGFEKTSFKNGSFDVAVGNIPFGDFSLQYDRQSLKIHDYFFMQALDKVKDGGIVAFVTSKGTLDKRDSSFRRMLAEKADLIGAVRLPNTAFKTAGTEVTADIIFLQKRQSPPEKMPDWVNIGASAAGLPINEYFVQHPEMVLGDIVQGNKMYGRNNDTMCVPFEGRELSELLPEAVSRIHAVFNAGLQVSEPMQNSEVQIPEGIRNYSYFEYKNNIYTIEDNEVVSLRDSWKRSYSPANIERAKAYIQIRDTVRELLAVQQETAPNAEDKIKELQAKLNMQYDSFYKKYGLMHSRFNAQLFRDDSSYPLMLSLEDKIDKDKLIRKSDIFYKRTIRVSEVVDKVDTPQEALVLSLAEKGKVDLEYMSALTDLPQKAIISDLKGDIFPVPELSHGDNIVYQTASEYLSGDIYAKLSAAKFAAENNSVFADNVPALEAAVPTPLTAGEIDIECGATWIPKEIYQQFMYETFKTANEHRADCPPRFPWQLRGRKNIEIDYSPHTNKWNITNKSVDHSVTTDKTFGTKAKNAYTIFEAVLNLHIPNITKTIPDPDDPSKDKKVMDIEATKLVKRKAEAIRKEFKDWIFKDPERRKMLVDLYNRQFNCVRPREYDGSHLQFHGMNASIELHQHQKNAIAHAIYGGNTLFAHCVGAGKTFEMIATAMESKRLGLCSKSLFVVPNHLTEQVGADFMKLYPNANILVATKKDFTKQNRRKLLARIATGNYDAVIIGHSQLGMIPLSPERQERMYKEQIEDITRGIAELKAQSGESFQVKAMERTRKSLQQKLEKLSSSKKDDTLYFEELGIDKLFVDEAHEFKNLMSVTKLQNVSGISGRTSQRATELFMKCRYLDEKTGGRGVVFATGTPVSNSITELHTMMRYLQYDFLSQHGMQNFDNWVSVFGKQKTDYELAPTGDKFKARTRIASYANMPELMTMFKQCADVRTSDSLNLPVPDCELHIVNTEPTELQQALVQELSARADDVQNGIVEPHEDNMLKITGDGRKVGLDPRLVNPDLEDDPNTKLNQCVRNVFQIWQDTAADKLTQIIFCDLGVPKPNQTDSSKDSETDEKSMADIDSLEESGTFCVYDDIKSKLVAMGIPKEEIAFIHDAKTEAQKSDLFEKVRSGEIRVLLGSTAKMGTGTNVQDRLIALHDLDVPWRPSDLEQRRGRMVRQGNINEKVHLYRYVTKGTFDAYSYQLLETKQRFISQVITSKTPARTCSDVDQEALTYSEIKALCTGDERIKEKLTLENRVKELQLFEKEYRDTHFELEDKVAAYPEKREQMCVRIEKLEQDFEKCKAIPFDEEGKPVFSMIINGTMYTVRKEAAEALKTALDIVYTDRDRAFPIGEIYGFKIFAAYDTVNECIRGIIKGELEYSVGLSTMPSVNVNKFEKLTIGIEKHLDDARKKLEQADIDIESAKAILAQPFEFAAELADKTERLADLTDELNAEAAERLQSAEKKPRTHYFGKDTILSIPKKEAPKKDEQEHSQEHDNKKGGEAI